MKPISKDGALKVLKAYSIAFCGKHRLTPGIKSVDHRNLQLKRVAMAFYVNAFAAMKMSWAVWTRLLTTLLAWMG